MARGVEDLVKTPAASTLPTLIWTEPKSLAARMRLVQELQTSILKQNGKKN